MSMCAVMDGEDSRVRLAKVQLCSLERCRAIGAEI